MPTYEPFDWYATPLYYDIIFDADTAREADFILGAWERFGPGLADGRAVVHAFEPACGSGRLMIELIKRGWCVDGFDLSDGMLEFARQRLATLGLSGDLSNQPMQDFKLPHAPGNGCVGYDLAFNFVSTFKYLLTEDDARHHLQCVADHLRPGGLYLLGFHLTEDDQATGETERWVSHRDGLQVVCNIHGFPPDHERRIERVRSRLVVTDLSETGNQAVRRFESSWDFRTYNTQQRAALLASVPSLEAIAVYDFTYDLDHPPGEDEMLDQLLILRRTA